jgi:hypothetical protein
VQHHDNPFNAADFHFRNKSLPETNERQLINDKEIAGDSICKYTVHSPTNTLFVKLGKV